MRIILGLVYMIASGCGLYVAHAVAIHMPGRWSKTALVAMFISSSGALGILGGTIAFGLEVPEWVLDVLRTTFALSVIILFACFTGKLNGQPK